MGFEIGDKVKIKLINPAKVPCDCGNTVWAKKYIESFETREGVVEAKTNCKSLFGNIMDTSCMYKIRPNKIAEDYLWICCYNVEEFPTGIALKPNSCRCRCNGKSKPIYLGIGPAAPIIHICETCGEEK
jgi:hypothetical protein